MPSSFDAMDSPHIRSMRSELLSQFEKTRGKYPGLGLPLRYMARFEGEARRTHYHYPIGAHPSCEGSKSVILMIRELAMMDIMEKLTDKKDWHKKVFMEDLVAKWREEALAIPDEELCRLAVKGKLSRPMQVIHGPGHNQVTTRPDDEIYDDWGIGLDLKGVLSEATFDYCIEELRHKAQYFEQSGIVPTLDACASVAKSDSMITPELQGMLRNAFQKLKADQACPDWHPNSDEMVQDLVHPSMYPLIYDRSRVYSDEVVSVTDAVESWSGKGSVIVNDIDYAEGYRYAFGRIGGQGSLITRQSWSETYQWLPANIAFKDDGGVRFTSYINNLHPTRYQDIYRALEKLVEASLPMWDQCLILHRGRHEKFGVGRMEPRLLPEDPSDHNPDNWEPLNLDEIAKNIDEDELEEFLDDWGVEYDRNDMEDPLFAQDFKEWKWEQVREPRVPEPIASKLKVEYTPQESSRLVDRFSESGLQVIVKIASIELTPEKPSFPAGGWHVEGMMNERICATSIYYLDSKNVTPSDLSFRMHTDYELGSTYGDERFQIGQDDFHWMQDVYGVRLRGDGSPCLQNYGTVDTKEGRLLAFPNVFHQRVSGFQLKDLSKPGHQRFIALWLVDPTRRIISTANVPPQQMSWWTESVFGSSSDGSEKAKGIVDLLAENGHVTETAASGLGLPPELTGMIHDYYQDDGPIPIGSDDAQKYRLELMEERSSFQQDTNRHWESHIYGY